MNGFAALCTFIAAFSPPMSGAPITPPQEIVQSADVSGRLQAQDERMDGPRVEGVIYFDGPISGGSRRIYR